MDHSTKCVTTGNNSNKKHKIGKNGSAFMTEFTAYVQKNGGLVIGPVKKPRNTNDQKVPVVVPPNNTMLEVVCLNREHDKVIITDGGRTIKSFKNRAFVQDVIEYAYFRMQKRHKQASEPDMPEHLKRYEALLGSVSVMPNGALMLACRAQANAVVSACYFLSDVLSGLETRIGFLGAGSIS